MGSLYTPPFYYQERGAKALTDDTSVEKRDQDLEHYLWTPHSHVCIVQRTTNQSIPNSIDTTVQFDTAEYDPESMFSLSTFKWTAPFAGIWGFTLGIHYSMNTVGNRRLRLFYTSITPAFTLGFNIGAIPASPDSGTIVTGYREFFVNGGDTVEGQAFQSSGAPLNIAPFEFQPSFSVSFISRPSFVG